MVEYALQNALVLLVGIFTESRQLLRFGDPFDQQPADIQQQTREQLVLRTIGHGDMKIEVRLNVQIPITVEAGGTLRNQRFEHREIFGGGSFGRESSKFGFQNQARLAYIRQIFFGFQESLGEDAIQQAAGRL